MIEDNGAKNAPSDDDTVSLVDLFAVLLKHRRLIILSTVGAAILALAGYFIYPPLSLDKAERDRIVEVNMSLMLASSFKDIIGEAEGSNFILQSLSDPATIVSALKTAGYDSLEKTSLGDGADQNKALYTIRRRLVENKGLDGSPLKESSRRYAVKLDKSVISVVFKNGDDVKAKAFLEALKIVVEAELKEFVLPFAESTIESYERLLAIQKPNEAIEASIAQGYRAYSAANKFIADAASPLAMLRRPYVLMPELSLQVVQKDVLKKAVIVVFAVFFLAVFAAFALQYVETVKKDPESMKKIQDALAKRA